MAYAYGKSKSAHLDALRIRKQIEEAEIEKAERELAELQEVELELARLQRRRERVSEGLREARKRTTTTRVALRLPPPIHGGREGLEAAAREAAEHEYKSGVMARTPRNRRKAS